MDTMQFPCGHNVVITWIPHGFQVDTTWFPGGHHMVSMWIPWEGGNHRVTTGGWLPWSHHGRVVTMHGNHGSVETTE